VICRRCGVICKKTGNHQKYCEECRIITFKNQVKRNFKTFREKNPDYFIKHYMENLTKLRTYQYKYYYDNRDKILFQKHERYITDEIFRIKMLLKGAHFRRKKRLGESRLQGHRLPDFDDEFEAVRKERMRFKLKF